MELILKGIVTGFILSIMIGPVFFVLLETSIRKGIKAALFFDLGVLLNDVVYILIAFVFYKEVNALFESEDNSILRIIGGSLFFLYGLYYLFWKKVDAADLDANHVAEISTKNYMFLFVKGFLLNLANPMVVFYWFSVLTLGDGSSNGASFNTSIAVFLIAILTTFFSIDILKILGAKKLRPLLNGRLLKGLNQLIGIVFFVFGIVLIVQGIIKASN
jgi:threonine/homoserine/homoserine lactone efflux protein